jgi:hypothetical protein
MSHASSLTSLSSFLVSSFCDDISGRGADDRLLGNVRFLGFYLVGGIASTMASLFWRRLRGDHTTSSEGASGAIYSCMGTSILLCLHCLQSSLFPVFSFPPLLLMLNSATLPSYSPYPLNSPLRQKLTNSILRCNVPSNSILTILRSPHASLVIRRWNLCRESLAPFNPFCHIYVYQEGPQDPS